MKAGLVDRAVMDVRGMFNTDGLLELAEFADHRPGEEIEVISDSSIFALGLLRWCGEGYGRIENIEETGATDRFVVQLPTRNECAAVGLRPLT